MSISLNTFPSHLASITRKPDTPAQQPHKSAPTQRGSQQQTAYSASPTSASSDALYSGSRPAVNNLGQAVGQILSVRA